MAPWRPITVSAFWSLWDQSAGGEWTLQARSLNLHFLGMKLLPEQVQVANPILILVLVPVFNDPNDRVALDIFADIFPDHDIVGIYCGDLIWGLGAIHCMTQPQPAFLDVEKSGSLDSER